MYVHIDRKKDQQQQKNLPLKITAFCQITRVAFNNFTLLNHDFLFFLLKLVFISHFTVTIC